MSDVVTTALSPLLVVLSIVFVWPQVVRSFRSVEGLSLASMTQSVVGAWLWVLYGVRTSTPPLVLANGSAGIGFVLVLIAAVRAGAIRPGRVAVLGVAAGAIAAGQAFVAPPVLGWCAIVVGATGILPQVAHTLRSTDHRGVSRPTYMMIVVLTTGWSVYGALVGDWLIVVPNGVILPSALAVLFVTRPSASRPAAATSASSSATV